jgi:hypothetical protein
VREGHTGRSSLSDSARKGAPSFLVPYFLGRIIYTSSLLSIAEITRIPSVHMVARVPDRHPQFSSPFHERITIWLPPAKIIEPSRENITSENEWSTSLWTFLVLIRPATVKQPIILISKRNPANTSFIRNCLPEAFPSNRVSFYGIPCLWILEALGIKLSGLRGSDC